MVVFGRGLGSVCPKSRRLDDEPTHEEDLTKTTLDMALCQRRSTGRSLHHSDRGRRYADYVDSYISCPSVLFTASFVHRDAPSRERTGGQGRHPPRPRVRIARQTAPITLEPLDLTL